MTDFSDKMPTQWTLETTGAWVAGMTWLSGCRNGMTPSMYGGATMAMQAGADPDLVMEVCARVGAVPWLAGEFGIVRHPRDITDDEMRMVREAIAKRAAEDAAKAARIEERAQRRTRQFELNL
jgi:hypothetical protein